jgi:hypothetical protein
MPGQTNYWHHWAIWQCPYLCHPKSSGPSIFHAFGGAQISHMQPRLTTAQFPQLWTITVCPNAVHLCLAMCKKLWCSSYVAAKGIHYRLDILPGAWWDSCLNFCGNSHPPTNLLKCPHPCTSSSGFQLYITHRQRYISNTFRVIKIKCAKTCTLI